MRVKSNNRKKLPTLRDEIRGFGVKIDNHSEMLGKVVTDVITIKEHLTIPETATKERE